MTAIQFAQEFICFSFVIEDGRYVINVSEVYWKLWCSRKYFFFITFSKDVSQSWTKW